MSTTADLANVAVLARKLEQEILARGLRAGDRYRTAADAAVMLGVSTASAHRAMSVLVRKRLLVRHRGRGTFVGPAVPASAPPIVVRTAFVLIPEALKDVSALPFDVILDSLRAGLASTLKLPEGGGVNVQFSFIPAARDAEYVRTLVRSAQAGGQFVGAIAISCSRDVYRCLGDLGGPVVVFGSLYRDQRSLPSLDLDYHQAGHLLAKYLCDRGHKRMALLAVGAGRPGDEAFLDGVSEALTLAGRPHNALVMRVFPGDVDAFRAQVSELLTLSPRPTGIICGSEQLLRLVEPLIEQLGLRGQVEIVLHSHATPRAERCPYVHVQSQRSFAEIASAVAGMLARRVEGKPLENDRIVLPVELRMPRS